MSIPKTIIFNVDYIGDTDEAVICGDYIHKEKHMQKFREIPFDYVQYRLVTDEQDKIQLLRDEIEKMSHCGVMRSMDNTIKSNVCKEILDLIDLIAKGDE